ncbi:LysR substrate-binding domain-containing protein [Pseudanabaena sp. ABRG5-3]|uniref:LysR substrate-binding domain-containing protein n=1 Tax=Pseudanabaena sp. ABRG5-3 TaxID=685565 RepID=UPI000DC72F72|nr:LysR substrate-binding domain-containing protein [Pseudanabaena sp. ABRG5-3]BBC26878.1 transcriptional regulator, LysR family [Pseudanabaena sp. ABRG5-3]
MTLEQLRIFLAVAEHLHFTRAAEELYITQPAVSAAVQSLEQWYGVKLFHRIGRHIEITDAGILLQTEAKDILDRVKLMERGLRELNDLQRGELKLGTSLTIGNYWLPAKISQFQELYPNITIKCTLANTEEICDGTAAGLFDLGLIEAEVKPTLQKTLDQEEIGSDRLLIVVGKAHPWYTNPIITIDQLSETAWVMRESGSGTQQVFEQALLDWGVDLSKLAIMLVLSSGEMVKAALECSARAAAISELMVQKEFQLDILRKVTVVSSDRQHQLEIKRPFLKLTHNQRFQTRIAKVFGEILRS